MSQDQFEELKENRTSTQVLINSANIIDQADQEMFPAVYVALEHQLGFSPVQNGLITTSRSFLQAITTPLWGFFGDKYSRNKILALGCFFWGIFTFLVATATSFETMILFRSLSGIGLAVIIPTAYSLLSDYFPEHQRGKAFGLIGLTGVLGAIVGTLYATGIQEENIFGIAGWRFAFMTLAFMSFLLGLAIYFFGKDPIRGSSEKQLVGIVSKKTEEKYKITLKSSLPKILANRTYMLILAQGVLGTIPWAAIAFIIAWFQYVGFSGIISAIMFAIIAMGAALGNLFGGMLGDRAAHWNRDKGRIMIAQISVFSGIPLIIVIFWLIPRETSNFLLFIVLGFITGFMIIWTAPGTNNPIFSELFEPEIRSTAFGFDRLFEGSIAATGTFIVGVLAQYVFGYIDPMGKSIDQLDIVTRNANVNALANGMVVTMVIPWIFCFLIYFLVYFSYPKDRDKANAILDKRKQEILENQI
ncbi:MAG: MFS transporter [Candidatus Thorarchaeota archaeon]